MRSVSLCLAASSPTPRHICSLGAFDGRPVCGLGGLDGPGGRTGGQETTPGDWDGLAGRFSSRCQGEGRGFESRRPLHFAEARHEILALGESFEHGLDRIGPASDGG